MPRIREMTWTDVEYIEDKTQRVCRQRWFMRGLGAAEKVVAYDACTLFGAEGWWLIPYTLQDYANYDRFDLMQHRLGPYATRKEAQTVAEMLFFQGET